MLNFILCGDFRFCLSRLLHVIRRRSPHICSRLTSIFISSIIFDDRQGGSGSSQKKPSKSPTKQRWIFSLIHLYAPSLMMMLMMSEPGWLSALMILPIPRPMSLVSQKVIRHFLQLHCLSVSVSLFFCGRIKNICKLFPYGRILHSNHLSFYDYSSSFPCSSVSIYN